jgi:hypothetical protein
MRLFFSLSLSIFCFTTVLGQSPGEVYNVHLAFQDAVGNRDTIWIVRDTLIGTDSIDADYGEIVITEPFGGDLDVRIQLDDQPLKCVKKRIYGSLLALGSIQINARVKNPPLLVTWDTAYIAQTGVVISWYITESDLPFLAEAPYLVPDDVWECLTEGENSSIFMDSSFNTRFHSANTAYYDYYAQDSFYGFWLIQATRWWQAGGAYSPCNTATPTWLWLNDQSLLVIETLVYPNPVIDRLQWDLPPGMGQPDQIFITDNLGRAMSQYSSNQLNGNMLSLEDIIPGLYQIRMIWNKENKMAVSKFVKLD